MKESQGLCGPIVWIGLVGDPNELYGKPTRQPPLDPIFSIIFNYHKRFHVI